LIFAKSFSYFLGDVKYRNIYTNNKTFKIKNKRNLTIVEISNVMCIGQMKLLRSRWTTKLQQPYIPVFNYSRLGISHHSMSSELSETDTFYNELMSQCVCSLHCSFEGAREASQSFGSMSVSNRISIVRGMLLALTSKTGFENYFNRS